MRDGKVLWSQNGHLRLPMASTTKLMTALVALRLEHDRLNTPMTVPPQVSQAYGELLYLRAGDQYTFGQLLEGMLLPSANDAAIAIAVDAAGSQTAFVHLMNQTAAAYGLVDTHYANPDGLDAPDHYSSADDLARLGWIAMNNPIIRQTVDKTSATIPWPRHTPNTRLIGNINSLLTSYPGANGVKTGYTSEALNVVVGSAVVDGEPVIAVLMGEPKSTFWTDEYRLLNYAGTLAAARGQVATVPPPSAAAAPVPTVPRLTSPGAPAAFPEGSATSAPTTVGATLQATLLPDPAAAHTTAHQGVAARAGGGGWLLRAVLAAVALLVLGVVALRLQAVRAGAVRLAGVMEGGVRGRRGRF